MDDSEGPGKGVVLKNADGLLKKPNASQPLGRVSSVTIADTDSSKYPQSVQVRYICLRCMLYPLIVQIAIIVVVM